MKALGKDIKAAYDAIPEGFCHDGGELDEEFGHNFEVTDLEDDGLFDLTELGFDIIEDPLDNYKSFAGAFKKWKAKQGRVNVVLSIDKQELEAALELIKDIKGVKIIK